FQIALLRALEQVGDRDALPHVRGLAESIPATMRQRQVVRAANDCLPYLEACAEQNRNSQILLRAITDPILESNLLRPIGKQGEADPDLLVRVASPPDRS